MSNDERRKFFPDTEEKAEKDVTLSTGGGLPEGLSTETDK